MDNDLFKSVKLDLTLERSTRLDALRTSVVYLVFGGMWILFSEGVLSLIIKNHELYTKFQTFKGWLFIIITTLLLYFLIEAYYSKIIKLTKQLVETNQSLISYSEELIAMDEDLNEKVESLSGALAESIKQKKFVDEIYNNGNIAIMIWNLEGEIIDINEYFLKEIGYRYEEVVGQKWQQLILPKSDRHLMLELIRQLQLNQHVKKFENKVRSKNGQESIYLWNDQIIQSPTSDELIVVSFGVNISYEKEMEKRALDLAYTDRLTGFKNRTSFENDVADLIHNHYEFSIFYLDFDRFRTLNDTHGHKYGDLFLKMYSEALRKTFSKNRLYRWCGDEFLIVFDSRDTNEVLNLLYLQQIFELTHKKWQFEHVTYYPTVSIGTARFPADADNISDLLKNLDIALHKAKSLGKGNFIAFDKIFLEESERILNIEHKINQAIEDNQFRLVYQPIYNLQNKSIRAFEILLRWDQEENLTTGELIEIAERTGQIVKIDQWVIQNAFQSIAKYKFNEQILISINLSGQTFNSREILDYIDEKLTENNINPQRIEFEVTEHSIIQDFNYAVEMIELLRKKRFRIALDDFGTRYSSLNYLSRLPLDVLKIDKSYVDYITQNNNDSMVVEHLIQLSTKLNLNTIAEGIETKEQELLLEKIGCQMGQGYLFSKPVDIEKAVEMSNK